MATQDSCARRIATSPKRRRASAIADRLLRLAVQGGVAFCREGTMLVIGGGFNCNVISLTTGASTGGLLLRTHNHTRANTRASTHTRTIPPLLHLPGATLHESTRSGRVRCVALSPTGDYVLAGGFDNMVTVQLVGGGAEMQSFDATAFFDHEQDDPLGRPPKPLPRSEVRGSLAGSVRSSSSCLMSRCACVAASRHQIDHR